MLQVRDDNIGAFEELVERYQSRLVGIMEHLVHHRDQAEDLAQDVFLRVYRARKNYVPAAKFSTWLFTIANNLAFNANRSSSRRKEVHVSASKSGSVDLKAMENLAVANSGEMPTRQLDKVEIGTVIRSAICRLSERQRMAVLLCRYENMSYQEIGETMDLTVQAVKSLLSRARANLRETLEPYVESGKFSMPVDSGAHPI